MSQSELEAMQLLERASPNDGATTWWTHTDEDAVLAEILASSKSRPEPKRQGAIELRRRSQAVRIGIVAGACTLAGICALVVVNPTGSGPQAAYADWTATTTTPPASQLAAADAACRTVYEKSLLLPGMQPPSGPGLPSTLPPLVLTDSRGPYEFLVYAGVQGEGTCLWGASGALGVGATNGGQRPAPNSDSIGVPGVGYDHNGGSPLTYAYGHAGSEVTGVTLQLADGAMVEVTVHDGWYAAWWPGEIDVVSTTVTAAGSVTHESFGDVGPNNPSNPGELGDR